MPLPSPSSLPRRRPLNELWGRLGWAAVFAGLLVVHYCILWKLIFPLELPPFLLGYLAAPALLLIGPVLAFVVTLLWLPGGTLLPALHDNPMLARGIAEFWGRRWNLWFSDWFRYVIFAPRRHRPTLALVLVFFVSGLMHEWVINLPLYLFTGKAPFGTMMVYFLLQAAGVLLERRFLKRKARARTLFAWLVVFVPAPLVLNEGLLRTLHLWPH